MAFDRRTPEQAAQALANARRQKAKEVLAEQKSKIKSARYALLVLGILQTAYAIYEYQGLHLPILILFIDGGIGLLFTGLYFYSKENPKAAFLAGLIAYCTLQFLAIAIDGKNAFNGILIKIVIIVILVGGLSALKRIPKSLLEKKPDDNLLDEDQTRRDLL